MIWVTAAGAPAGAWTIPPDQMVAGGQQRDLYLAQRGLALGELRLESGQVSAHCGQIPPVRAICAESRATWL